MGSAGRTGRGRPFCSNGARAYHARRRTGSRAGPPTPSHGYRRPTTRSSAVVAQKWMGEISGGGSRETLEEIERTDAKHVNLRWSVEMTAAAKIRRDLTVGCSPGSTQSERPKRGDRANAYRSQSGGQRHRGSRDFVPRRWRPEAAAGSVEHADRKGWDPLLRTLCRGWASYALSTASPSSMEANTKQR